MKAVLLVIDVQEASFHLDPTMTQSLVDAVETINGAIALFRAHDLPVICIQHVDEDRGLVPGQRGFDLPDTLHVLPSDLHIHKRYGNAFNKTSLHDELVKRGVDTVIITGFAAEYCVLGTYRGALDLDLRPILLRGALASGEPDHIAFVERICGLVSYGALKTFLG